MTLKLSLFCKMSLIEIYTIWNFLFSFKSKSDEDLALKVKFCYRNFVSFDCSGFETKHFLRNF